MDVYTTTSTRPKPKTMAGTTNEEEGDKGEDNEDEDETGLEMRQTHLEPVCHVKKGPNNVFHVIWVIRMCFFIFFFMFFPF